MALPATHGAPAKWRHAHMLVALAVLFATLGVMRAALLLSVPTTTTAAEPRGAGGSQSSCAARQLELQQVWTDREGSALPRRPAHIEAALHKHEQYLLRKHRRSDDHEEDRGGSNSVEVSEEDLERARQNIITSLAPHIEKEEEALPGSSRSSSGGGGRCGDALGMTHGYARAALYSAIREPMQARALDAAPVIVDFGCSLGPPLAHRHPRSTVVCAVPDRTALTVLREAGAGTDNFLWIGFASVVDEPFSQIYESCNLISVALALGAVRSGPDEGGPPTYRSVEQHLEHIALLVPAAALTFALIPSDALPALQRLVNDSYFSSSSGSSSGSSSSPRAAAVPAVVELEIVAHSREPVELRYADNSGRASASVVLVMLRLRRMTRPCRKTFGAPLLQWDRSQSVSFNDGQVTFVVQSVAKGEAAGVQKRALRTIHPLQYIPSLNLDTLLGLGLAAELRWRLLGQMIATPRYSDPLPHNWVLAGGGRLLRIDRVDARYDRDVDEAKGYWGVSTRGYLHLLAYHLCLPTRPNGLPALPSVSDVCFEQHCRRCARECSYLPKGAVPCTACRECGLRCIESGAVAARERFPPPPSPAMAGKAAAASVVIIRTGAKCQNTYGSMTSARKVWRKWQRADERHPL